jgi:hypothetical protein
MRRLAVALGVLALTAGCGSTKTVVQTRTETVIRPASPFTTGDQWFHVQIRSIARDGDHFLVRVDPSWFLSGIAANVAQAQDQGRRCKPDACQPVDNDNYVVEESHRAYTFILPDSAHGTVLTSSSDRRTISAAELAALVHKTSSLHLFESLQSGVWIYVHIDTVRTFAQQYVP